jgi:hypothetical protein
LTEHRSTVNKATCAFFFAAAEFFRHLVYVALVRLSEGGAVSTHLLDDRVRQHGFILE